MNFLKMDNRPKEALGEAAVIDILKRNIRNSYLGSGCNQLMSLF